MLASFFRISFFFKKKWWRWQEGTLILFLKSLRASFHGFFPLLINILLCIDNPHRTLVEGDKNLRILLVFSSTVAVHTPHCILYAFTAIDEFTCTASYFLVHPVAYLFNALPSALANLDLCDLPCLGKASGFSSRSKTVARAFLSSRKKKLPSISRLNCAD